jgi:Fe-S-cluster-containing hydrogenase component 2
MSFIVDNKLNRFVLCNPEKCMACYTCMSACYESAKTRGKVAKSRLVVVHTELGSMPNQCRHCEDAPCSNVCPTGAIKLGKDKVELYEELCIGCKMCVMVCPFGAVLPESETMPSVDYMFEEAVDKCVAVGKGCKTVAVKCDLCEGRIDGPACVQACPNKALTYYNPESLESAQMDVKARNAVLKLVSYFKKSSPSDNKDKGLEG